MSLMKTLAKVAIGVAVAKGVSNVVQGGKTRGGRSAGNGGLFGGSHSPQRTGTGTGGLEDLMGSVLGGRSSGSTGTGRGTGGGTGGGLGGLLEQLSGGRGTGGGTGGGLDGLLKNLGGGGAASGGLGGLIEGLAGKTTSRPRGQEPGGSFGDVLNSSFERFGEPEVEPTPEQDALAGLLLKAMIQAAKSDGKIDAAEKEKLLGKLGDVSRAEMEFVNAELTAPVDIDGLARQIPKGLEQQVYLMSVMGIDLDSQKEAQYLHDFATALGIGKREVNHIHAQLGVPELYT